MAVYMLSLAAALGITTAATLRRAVRRPAAAAVYVTLALAALAITWTYITHFIATSAPSPTAPMAPQERDSLIVTVRARRLATADAADG